MTAEMHGNTNGSVARILLAVAALLGALVLYELARFVAATGCAEMAVARATAAGPREPDAAGAYMPQAKALAEAIKKQNLFIPPQPKTHPVREVTGILGNEALINGQWYSVGAKVGDAEVLAVEATRVKVAWDGQEKEFTPTGSESGPEGEASPEQTPRPTRSQRGDAVAPVARPAGSSRGRSPRIERSRELPANMSPEDIQRFRQARREQAAQRR